MMKRAYESPKLTCVVIALQDILTASESIPGISKNELESDWK